MANIESSVNLLEKVPPQSREAEMSVLGAMLLEEEALVKAIELVRPALFYEESHRKIFSAMENLFEKNKPVDLVTVTEELRSTHQLEAVGGASYLAHLSTCVPTAAHLEHYARIVREKAILRGLIQSATQIVQQGYDPTEEVSHLLDRAEQMIFDLSQYQVEGRVYSLNEIIHDSMETIDKLYQRKEHVTGLATGFHDLDTRTAGLQPSDFIIVAGRPSMGKSAFVSCLCEHIGVVLKKPIGFFSLEMSKEQLVQRMLCSHARVDAQKVRTGYLSHQDWPRLTSAAGKLSEAPIFIDDTPAQSVLEIRAKARRLKMQHHIELVVVDYLQLMQGMKTAENRQQELSEI
ncbi:MAG: replicative DNA helicase, partial [Candidatus Omnitrophica bacterium]|nr:replicative DNA helicase [Candidatus Omnitrophota bacterium]